MHREVITLYTKGQDEKQMPYGHKPMCTQKTYTVYVRKP